MNNENIENFARALDEIAVGLDNPMAKDYLSFVQSQWWWYRETYYTNELEEINDEMVEIRNLL